MLNGLPHSQLAPSISFLSVTLSPIFRCINHLRCGVRRSGGEKSLVTSPASFFLNSEHINPSKDSCIELLMAFIFRGKLVCFYCGCKSVQTRTPNVRRWQCAHCEAENYLDEVGAFIYIPSLRLVLLTCYTTEWRNHRSSSRRCLLQCSLCTIFCSANFSSVRDI